MDQRSPVKPDPRRHREALRTRYPLQPMDQTDTVTHYLQRLASAAFDEARAQAAAALSRFPDQAPELIPPLVKALGDQGPVVLVEAARTLGNFAGAARGAIPALERLLDHDNQLVRASAEQALQRIRGTAP